MTVFRLAFAVVAGLALATPAFAKGSIGYGSTGFTASADAASLARIRDARPIGTRTEVPDRERHDKVLEALKPLLGKKK
jgi:hypothetical protein